jgi:glycosyltransferase involved in cell wall biosynthesis
MQNTPLVSIVLPTYNGARYLASSIESCLNQTYSSIELIIVDDCSTDDTAQIAMLFAEKDPRVTVKRHEENRRLPEALNTGFEAANGELFTWTSDDNMYKPSAIEMMAKHLISNPKTDFVFCNQDIIDEKGDHVKVSVTGPIVELPFVSNIGACFLYRKHLHFEVGRFEDGWFCVEDMQYWLKMYFAGYRFDKIEEVPYCYRRHAGTLTDMKREMVIEQAIRLREEIMLMYSDKLTEYLRMRLHLECALRSMNLGNTYRAREHIRLCCRSLYNAIESSDNFQICADTMEKSLKLFRKAVIDNIVGVHVETSRIPDGRIIAWGALGRRGEKILPLLQHTLLEPSELWDKEGDGIIVKHPEVSSLKENDLVIVLPAGTQMEDIRAALKGTKCSVLVDDEYKGSLMTLISSVVFPQFYDGSVKVIPEYCMFRML